MFLGVCIVDTFEYVLREAEAALTTTHPHSGWSEQAPADWISACKIVMANLRADGVEAQETVMTFDDVRTADEVFLSGNMSKVTPVSAFDDRQYQIGPVTRRVREMYWDWAKSGH